MIESFLNIFAENCVKFVPWWSIPWIVFVFIIGFIFYFIICFCKPYFKLKDALNFIIDELKKHNKDAKQDHDYITDNIIVDEPFKHLWKEFTETIHRYKEEGKDEIKIRATSPAEAFFTTDVLVDSKLNADFFKHLPGILTGLGIIATFAGLIHGLTGFHPSENAGVVRDSLTSLLGGVKHAFLFSVLAILSAMVITFFEKRMLALCYKKTEELCTEIDKLYDMGVGEDYLARLVISSENNCIQTAHLKDALVNELKEILTNLAEKQIEAGHKQSQELATTIGSSLNEALSPTMNKLNEVVEKASGEQSSAVSGMLENILTKFMAKIDDTFGSQVNNINEGLNKSMQAMSTVQQEISELISNIKTSSQNATENMSDKLTQAMEQASISQNTMNEQMREFITQIKDSMLNQQTKSQEALDTSINGVLDKLNANMQQASSNQNSMNEKMHEFITQIKDSMLNQQAKSQDVLDKSVNGVLEQLNISMQKLAEDKINSQNIENQRHDNLKQQTQELHNNLSNEVSNLINAINNSIEKSDANISNLRNITMQAIKDMTLGAEHINQAADKFANSGNSIANTLDKVDTISTQLDTTSQVLAKSAQSVTSAFEQYDKTRASIERITAEFQAILNNSGAEAKVKRDLIREMENILGSIKNVEQESVEYLNTINSTLEKAFKSFSEQSSNQIANNMKQADEHTSSAIKSLKGIMQELAETLDNNMPNTINNKKIQR